MAAIAGLFASGATGEEALNGKTAQRLVEAGLQAEIAGDVPGRLAVLREALANSPDYAPARWHLGHVKIADQWMPVEEAQQASATDPRFIEYYALRTDSGDSPAGQLALARWCQKKGLEEEARFHWAGVLSVQPNHEEAQRALGVRWYDGRLLTAEQMEAARERRRANEQANRAWKARAATWERRLSGDFAVRTALLDEIRALTSLEAIPVLEELTIGGDVATDLEAARCRQISLAYVDALSQCSDHAATESLVRHAVLAPLTGVRYAAADRLKERPLYDYAPILLDGLAAPIESWFRVTTGVDGSVHYWHTLSREGPFVDWSHEQSQSMWQRATAREVAALARERNALLPAAADPPAQAAQFANFRRFQVAARRIQATSRAAETFAQRAVSTELQVTEVNQTATFLNERIAAVLRNVTGEDFGPTPREWWNWWQEVNEYYQPNDRPTYNQQCYDYRFFTPRELSASCFPAGTPVWTKTGQRPIETLRIGDWVLSQNVDTGEIAYKPVIGTTLRPPSAIVKLRIGKEQIATTLGHPFWVSGTGWQMAKELTDGSVLHGVKSPVRLDASEPGGEAEAHNLVVADFATYFVGEAGILVHDNSPRRPTHAIVPGLLSSHGEPSR